jgi:hypothetical protein
MEPIDMLREHIAKFTCGKYDLPAIVLGHGSSITVICCCREFASLLRTEIAKIPEKEIQSLKINFTAGSVEFV